MMSERGENFLKSLAGSRASVVGRPVPVADMGRVMFIEDVFLGSETDIAFLNSFGMRAAFDGVDLFPPREAAFIRSCVANSWVSAFFYRYRRDVLGIDDEHHPQPCPQAPTLHANATVRLLLPFITREHRESA